MSTNISVIFLESVMYGEKTVYRDFTRTESEEKATNISLDLISRFMFVQRFWGFEFHRMLGYLSTNQWKNKDEVTPIWAEILWSEYSLHCRWSRLRVTFNSFSNVWKYRYWRVGAGPAHPALYVNKLQKNSLYMLRSIQRWRMLIWRTQSMLSLWSTVCEVCGCLYCLGSNFCHWRGDELGWTKISVKSLCSYPKTDKRVTTLWIKDNWCDVHEHSEKVESMQEI